MTDLFSCQIRIEQYKIVRDKSDWEGDLVVYDSLPGTFAQPTALNSALCPLLPSMSAITFIKMAEATSTPLTYNVLKQYLCFTCSFS